MLYAECTVAEKFSTSTQVLSLTSLKLLRGTDLVCSGRFVGFGAAVLFVRVEFDRVDDLLDLFIGQSGGRDLEASGTVGAGGDEYPCTFDGLTFGAVGGPGVQLGFVSVFDLEIAGFAEFKLFAVWC